jgi:hypothetical protein
MRNASDICFECGRRIPPGALVAIVHQWIVRNSVYIRRKGGGFWKHFHKRRDHWLCLDCAQSKHSTENSFAETRRCENCDREIRHWDFSQPMPSACCADCRRLAANKRSRERRRIEHEPIVCALCGEMFEPTRGDARFCCPAHRQAAYRERKSVTDDDPAPSGAKSANRHANKPERKLSNRNVA